MGGRRIAIRIRGTAYDALMELCKRYNLGPQSLVENLLVHTLRSLQDDELCRKEPFDDCIVYTIELPFSFPYECELFEFMTKNQRRVRIYAERIPKRYVINRFPFRTLITIILELTEKERQLILQDHLNARKLGEQYVNIAFELVKNFVIGFRRTTGIYYNIGVVEPPINLEEFQKRVEVLVFVKRAQIESFRIMPVKEESIIVVGKPLEEYIRNKILDYVVKTIHDSHNSLQFSYDSLDASIIFYYKEQWSLTILLSVIAMESALSYLIFNSQFKDQIMRMKKCKSEQELRNKFKKSGSLTKKIEKFLFPLLKELSINNLINRLRNIMKDLNDIYDLRSKIVHEGAEGRKEEAEKALNIASEFISIITSLIE